MVDPATPDPHPQHQEFLAAAFSDLTLAKEMLRSNPRLIASRDGVGETPLHSLVVENQLSAVEWLIQEGADPNAKELSDATPLHHAAKLGYRAMADLLLKNSANTNATDNNDERPLHFAAWSHFGGHRFTTSRARNILPRKSTFGTVRWVPVGSWTDTVRLEIDIDGEMHIFVFREQ